MDICSKKNLLIFIIGMLCLFVAHLSHATSNAIVAGSYKNSSNKTLPLLANSYDGGNTWIYPITIRSKLPSNMGSTAVFNGASCRQLLCNAGGYYTTTSSAKFPLLASSLDGGNTWYYPPTITSALPCNFKNGKFNSFGRCSGTNCIVAGEYYTKQNKRFPLLAMSHNLGQTWSYPPTIITNLPRNYDYGYFTNATSRATNFFGIGQYKSTSNKFLPLLGYSFDSGVTWSYPSFINTNLPFDYKNNGIFNSIVCSDSVCVVAGQYESTLRKNYILPLITTSHDRGLTWSYLPISSSILPPHFNGLISVNSVGCNGNNCIIAGEYRSLKSGNPRYPYLISSQDGGNNWNFPSSILNQLPADYMSSGRFYGAHCNQNICIASGEYQSSSKGKKNIPFLASSLDGGITWIYPSTITTNLPTHFLEGKFLNVHCNREDCVSEGQYRTKSSQSKFYPLLATSHDSGITWGYPSSVITNLPRDFNDKGIFSGGYSSFTLDNEIK